MASTRMREPAGVRWALRLVAVVYVFLLVVWPVSLVVKYTFADGMTALTTALNDPDVIHALKLTAVVALVSRRASTWSSASASRCCWCATSSAASGCCRR